MLFLEWMDIATNAKLHTIHCLTKQKLGYKTLRESLKNPEVCVGIRDHSPRKVYGTLLYFDNKAVSRSEKIKTHIFFSNSIVILNWRTYRRNFQNVNGLLIRWTQ